jgi:hypothetical protein
MSIGVFIPSVPWHVDTVAPIVRAYMQGPLKPDKIVIYLSGTDLCDGARIRSMKAHIRRIPNVYVQTEDKIVQAGPARQAALDLLDTDIVAYQDSDDLPHRMRISTIKEVFHNCAHLDMFNHSYDYKKWSLRPPNRFKWGEGAHIEGKVLYERYFPNSKFEEGAKHNAYGDFLPFPVHAGVPCIRRELLKEITWKPAEDLKIAPNPKTKTEDFEFCHEVLYRDYKKVAAVDFPCYLYTG